MERSSSTRGKTLLLNHYHLLRSWNNLIVHRLILPPYQTSLHLTCNPSHQHTTRPLQWGDFSWQRVQQDCWAGPRCGNGRQMVFQCRRFRGTDSTDNQSPRYTRRKVYARPYWPQSIGPEVVEQALKVLQVVANSRPDVTLFIEKHDFGGIAIDNHGVPLPDATLEACKAADAILMGNS